MALLLALVLALVIPSTARAQVTTRVSVGPGGLQANSTSSYPAISGDGRWVAFRSLATNLVTDDTNGAVDVFLHDRQTGTTFRVSVGPGGVQANAGSSDVYSPPLSSDGRWVAFKSSATNLVTDDTNAFDDVFVYDRVAGVTSRVSVASDGSQGNSASGEPSMSADGRWVAFASNAGNLVVEQDSGGFDVFVHDRATGSTRFVSVARPGDLGPNRESYGPSISADGQRIAFLSFATNLVPGDTNNVEDVFVRNLATGTTTRVSVGAGGAQANGASSRPAISADGRWVAFVSAAANLVAGDANGVTDVFVHDLDTGTTSRVSVGLGGSEANNSSNGTVAISANGRHVSFDSAASNLVGGDTNAQPDVFVRDRQNGTTTRVNVGAGGAQTPASNSRAGGISGDGRFATFFSAESILVPGDTNSAFDVFVHDLQHPGCPIALNPSVVTLPASTTTGTIDVTAPAGCPWTAASNDPVWLLITAGSSGTGNGSVGYRANANPSASRTGTLTIGGQTFTVNQASGLLLPPVATPDVYATPSGVPLVVPAPGVLANDNPNAGGPMTAVLVDGPREGDLVLESSGQFVYTPAPAFSGVETFTYRAVNGLGPSNTATVSITVPHPLAPLPPTDLFVHSISGNTVTLRWTVPDGGARPTNFLLEGGRAPGQVEASIPTNSVVPTFTIEAPTGSYYVRVHAVSGVFRSAASNEIRIHVNVPVAPSPPANLLGLVNGSTLALAWTNTYQGGAPTSLMLQVGGSLSAQLPLGLVERFDFSGVPPGTYTLSLLAQNAGGTSGPSNAVTLTFPGTCSGPPLRPAYVLAYRSANTVSIDWQPARSGPAPTGYVVHVTGAFAGSLPTTARSMSGTVPRGSYTLTVSATNPCGESAATDPQTVIVP